MIAAQSELPSELQRAGMGSLVPVVAGILAFCFCACVNVARHVYRITCNRYCCRQNLTMSVSGSADFTFGLAGFFALGGNPPRDVLLGFSASDHLMSGARLAISAVAVFKTPLFANPLKAMVAARVSESALPGDAQYRSFVLTPVIFAAAFAVASAVSDPSVIFGYIR